jgi:hypothetical protein
MTFRHGRNRLEISGTLRKIRGERCYGVGDASIGPTWRRNRRALFQGPEQRSIYQSIGFEHGDKPVPSAHGLDTSLLSRGKYLHGQSLEVAKNPQQVKPLRERRVEVSWSQRREHTQHTLGQLFHPHDRIT